MSTESRAEELHHYRQKEANFQLIQRENNALFRLGYRKDDPGSWLGRYATLLQDERPFLAPTLYGEDKFADLIRLVGQPAAFGWLHPEAEGQLQNYNLRHVQAMNNGQSRGSLFGMARLIPDLRHTALKICDRLEAFTLHHLPKPGSTPAAQRYETGGM